MIALLTGTFSTLRFVDLDPIDLSPLPPFRTLITFLIPVQVGGDGDDVYRIEVFEPGDLFPSQEYELTVGNNVLFSPPANRIRVTDLQPEGSVFDETGNNGFVFGVTFDAPGDILMTVVPRFVPAPDPLSLLLMGGAVAAATRRRIRAT